MKEIGPIPITIDGMTKSEIDAELTRGIESLKKDRSYSAEEVDAELESLFGILSDEIILEEALEDRKNKI